MQRLPKMSTPIWAILGVWTVICGFVTMHSVGLMGQWKQRANGFQRNNAYLARELTLSQQQLQQTRTKLADTQTQLAEMQNQVLAALMQRKATQNAAGEALFKAIRYNEANAVGSLLDAGADPNSVEWSKSEGRTALVIAVEMGYVESPEYAGKSPRKNLAVVCALLAHGADVNLRCSDGVTSPLSVARRHDSQALVALLKAAGAKE